MNNQQEDELSKSFIWRVILAISLGTGLSLAGDSSMYTVLPTHTAAAGVSLGTVGILLSINRWVRLPLNGPGGWLYERTPRRWLFIPAVFLGALSTGIYALSNSFWPLLIGRLLWGVAWVGIWVGGNTIILDISQDETRGRWVGIYQVSFFLGSGGSAILGGVLTDWVGYHNAMGINAAVTFFGAVVALLLLPETKNLRKKLTNPTQSDEIPTRAPRSSHPLELPTAMAILAMERLVRAGFMVSTFGLFLQSLFGEAFKLGEISIGIASATGLGLGMTTLITIVTTPLIGRFSDQSPNRWRVAALGFLPGLLGFGLLTTGQPLAILFGMLLIPITSGSNYNLSTSLVGDLSKPGKHSRSLGIMFTIGDLASAIGPPLAFLLIPVIQLQGLYWLSAVLFGLMVITAFWWDRVMNRALRISAY